MPRTSAFRVRWRIDGDDGAAETIRWDGRAGRSVAQAASPDVFTSSPVPPLFVNLTLRVRDEASASARVLLERPIRLLVPQVMQITWTDAAHTLLAKPLDVQVWASGDLQTVRLTRSTPLASLGP